MTRSHRLWRRPPSWKERSTKAARSTGLDATLDARAVDFALAHAEEVERLRDHGAFAAPDVPLPADASAQERLLHLTGRWPAGEVA